MANLRSHASNCYALASLFASERGRRPRRGWHAARKGIPYVLYILCALCVVEYECFDFNIDTINSKRLDTNIVLLNHCWPKPPQELLSNQPTSPHFNHRQDTDCLFSISLVWYLHI